MLALAAAVVLPMFLESDPKPLGPDVQIQIPAIDDAKFQNRLTPAGASKAPAADMPVQPAPSEPVKGQRETTDTDTVAAPATTAAVTDLAVNKTDPQAPAPAAASRPGETKSAAPVPAPATTPATTPAPAAALPAFSLPATVPRLGAAPALNPKSAPPAAPAVAQGEFVVQLGAFVDSAVARDLAAKAGEQGFPVFLEAVTTKSGQVQRVRVGPFATRGEADAAAAKLKGAGFTAVARPR